jgi:hypothetical protein
MFVTLSLPFSPPVVGGGRSGFDVDVAGDPFSIGPPEKYREPGVYDKFVDSHGVWVVSTGKYIFALCALCPTGDPTQAESQGCGTRFDSFSGRFRCPCDGTSFTREGLRSLKPQADDSMWRCRIDLIKGELLVDPRRRYSEARNQWSSVHSAFVFED